MIALRKLLAVGRGGERTSEFGSARRDEEAPAGDFRARQQRLRRRRRRGCHVVDSRVRNRRTRRTVCVAAIAGRTISRAEKSHERKNTHTHAGDALRVLRGDDDGATLATTMSAARDVREELRGRCGKYVRTTIRGERWGSALRESRRLGPTRLAVAPPEPNRVPSNSPLLPLPLSVRRPALVRLPEITRELPPPPSRRC